MGDKTLATILGSTTPPRPEEEDVGPCAAIAKNRWITALTIKHAGKPWESFQYRAIDARSTFEPTRFEVLFVGAEKTWRVVVTGRCLERLYNLVIQGRLEWIKEADRDFAADGEAIILGIEAAEVVEKK